MSIIKFCLLFCISVFATAAHCCPTLMKWKIENKPVETCFDKKADGYLSKSCEAKECGARVILSRAREVSLHSKLNVKALPQNPGEVLCEELGGTRRLATLDGSTSKSGFCEAKDGSVIDFNSLARAHNSKK